MDLSARDESSIAESSGVESGEEKNGDSTSYTSDSSKLSKRSGGSGGKKEKFVQKESQQVQNLRFLVVLILVLAALAVALVVYFVSAGGEDQIADEHFHASAAKVLDRFMEIASDRMEAVVSLAVAITAHGEVLGDPWPFMVTSSFQYRAATIKKVSGAIAIEYAPKVTHDQREAWENYSTTSDDSHWYQNGRAYQKILGIDEFDTRPDIVADDPVKLDLTHGIANHIYDHYHRSATPCRGRISEEADFYLPAWEASPVAKRTMVNMNYLTFGTGAGDCVKNDAVVFEGMKRSEAGYEDSQDPHTIQIAWLLHLANKEKTLYPGDIYTPVYFPLYNNFNDNRTVVGVLRILIHWSRYFEDLLPETDTGMIIVLSNECDEPYTYRIDGGHVVPLGSGDLHDPKFDDHMMFNSFRNITSVEDGTLHGMKVFQGDCPYSMRVYSSSEYEEAYHTETPAVVTVAVTIVFVFAIIMFFIYDWLVERRQKLLLAKATRTHQIVASLFPKQVRDQILQEDNLERKKGKGAARKNGADEEGKCDDDEEAKAENNLNVAQIADLYPDASIMFADIAGFTAWSSSREPQQVFILLQNIYHAFDTIAKHRKVFKVETVGDSYVAAAGVPEPQPTHAVIMARFAWECLLKMNDITRNLESLLGPDTGELTMRIGIHSGAVTAGVLRGAQSRFQLFGDTVNTASRMETTGVKARIQCSQSTAEALIVAGKEHWIKPRNDVVHAKGKGALKTFWVVPSTKAGSQSASTDSSGKSEIDEFDIPREVYAEKLLKVEREIDWVTGLLCECIRLIIAKNEAQKGQMKVHSTGERITGGIPLDDVIETIPFPDSVMKTSEIEDKAKHVRIPDNIRTLVRQYVSIIASAYKHHPFHNFEHACHMTMTVYKFLKRITAYDINQEVAKIISGRKSSLVNDDFIGAISSDPITHLSLVFAALIHDVDHRGVSNAQLAKEDPVLAARYREVSLAEQNSFEISWDLLMADHFNALRDYIFIVPGDLIRFRQLVVNCTLATNLFDKESNLQRETRWTKAFADANGSSKDARATVVLEVIMQSSDICHCMQHFHVYQKWMKNYFAECRSAYKQGRFDRNPSLFWYKGELAFFDNFVIPLASKLRDSNAFGVSSDECVTYAIQNKEEWESSGKHIIEEMMESGDTVLQK